MAARLLGIGGTQTRMAAERHTRGWFEHRIVTTGVGSAEYASKAVAGTTATGSDTAVALPVVLMLAQIGYFSSPTHSYTRALSTLLAGSRS